MTVAGIDCSSWQGDVDWAAVRASGRTFAFVKASEGLTYVDSKFARNRSGAQSTGMTAVGFYDLGHESNDPVAEANRYLAIVGSFAPNEFAVLDAEEVKDQRGRVITHCVSADWASRWAGQVRTANPHKVVLYCNTSDWRNVFSSHLPAGIDLWWAAAPGSSPPAGSTFHQYTFIASVPGVAGSCDDNHFNGTEAELAALVGKSSPSPSPQPAPHVTPAGGATSSNSDQLEQTINNAISQIGYHETGTNVNKFSEWLGGFDAAWCNAFLSWCAYQAGVRFPGSDYGDKGWAYVPNCAAAFKAANRWCPNAVRGAWGVIVNEIHITLVESVQSDGVHTIEGNESDQVMRRVRPRSDFEGFCLVAYSTNPVTNPITRKSEDDMPVSIKKGETFIVPIRTGKQVLVTLSSENVKGEVQADGNVKAVGSSGCWVRTAIGNGEHWDVLDGTGLKPNGDPDPVFIGTHQRKFPLAVGHSAETCSIINFGPNNLGIDIAY